MADDGIAEPMSVAQGPECALQSPAARYDLHVRPFAEAFGEHLIHGVAARLGGVEPMRILDHGAGTGVMSSLAARRWPSSRRTLLDPSAEMLEVVADGLAAETVVGTSLPDSIDGFDLVLSNLVLMFCDDAAATLAHLHDNTVDGSCLGLTVLGEAGLVGPFDAFWSAARRVRADAWTPERYPHHRFADAAALCAAVESAGWVEVVCDRIEVVDARSADDGWAWVASSLPVGLAGSYGQLMDHELDATRDEFTAAWEASRRSSGWLVTAKGSGGCRSTRRRGPRG